MKPPIFPQKFIRDHCPKVEEAAYWRVRYEVKSRTAKDDLEFAECNFVPAGGGMKCSNCEIFLTRPFLGHQLDEKYLLQIEEYYRKLNEYNKWQEQEQKEREAIEQILGSGI